MCIYRRCLLIDFYGQSKSGAYIRVLDAPDALGASGALDSKAGRLVHVVS